MYELESTGIILVITVIVAVANKYYFVIPLAMIAYAIICVIWYHNSRAFIKGKGKCLKNQ